jgi:hypothetical protein
VAHPATTIAAIKLGCCGGMVLVAILSLRAVCMQTAICKAFLGYLVGGAKAWVRWSLLHAFVARSECMLSECMLSERMLSECMSLAHSTHWYIHYSTHWYIHYSTRVTLCTIFPLTVDTCRVAWGLTLETLWGISRPCGVSWFPYTL